jgi:hypothetical protein
VKSDRRSARLAYTQRRARFGHRERRRKPWEVEPPRAHREDEADSRRDESGRESIAVCLDLGIVTIAVPSLGELMSDQEVSDGRRKTLVQDYVIFPVDGHQLGPAEKRVRARHLANRITPHDAMSQYKRRDPLKRIDSCGAVYVNLGPVGAI